MRVIQPRPLHTNIFYKKETYQGKNEPIELTQKIPNSQQRLLD